MALSAIPGSAQPADHLLVALADDARRSVDVLAGTPRSTSICPTTIPFSLGLSTGCASPWLPPLTALWAQAVEFPQKPGCVTLTGPLQYPDGFLDAFLAALLLAFLSGLTAPEFE